MSAKLQTVIQHVHIVGPTDSTVLIQGETGTGKEMIANLLHQASARRDHPLVKVNCAAIPLGLLESELFGHERGAFTGAVAQRVGRFELANRGTLFLDEVGDIPFELQPKLLRVLQEQEFERLGSTRTIRVNVRVITATHRDLSQMVDDGEFRADLLYRINVFPISVPPLRERPDDIPMLVQHFVELFAGKMNKRIETISPEVMQCLMNHPWYGNVRELENFIERAVILSRGSCLDAPVAQLTSAGQSKAAPTTLREAERAHILRVLRETDGVIAFAATRLGIPRSTLFYKMRRLGIPTARSFQKPQTISHATPQGQTA